MRSTSKNIEKLDSITFDDLLAKHDPFGKSKNCRFDLTSVRLITPVALVSLAAVCFGLADLNRQPVIMVEDPSVRSYLLRAGFAQALDGIATFEPHFASFESLGFNALRGSNEMLIEVTKINSGESLSDMLDQIVSVLRRRLKYRKTDAYDVATAISEIAQNTFDHNKATSGFLAMQVYGKGKNRFLEIGVADCGEGLARTLRRNPKHALINSDRDAISTATRLGTSEHDDPTRGTGLYHLLEIAYRTEGSVQIRSGQAKVRYRMDRRRGWAFNVVQAPGVQIGLTLRSRENLALGNVA